MKTTNLAAGAGLLLAALALAACDGILSGGPEDLGAVDGPARVDGSTDLTGAEAGVDSGQDTSVPPPDKSVTPIDNSVPIDKSVPPDAALPDAPPPDAPAVDQGVDLSPPDQGQPDQGCGTIACDCTYKGKKLWGKVKFVTAFPDFKIRVVSVFEDLKVQKVTMFPNSCGKWQVITTGIPDFTVQEVTFSEDFKVRYVTMFPGLP